MKPLIQHIRTYWQYYLLSILVIITGLISLLYFEKGEAVLLFNKHQTKQLNLFFMGMTKMGEFTGGLLVFIVIALFAKSKYMLIFLVSVGVSTTASQLLKRGVFEGEKRPAAFYEDLNEVENLERHSNFSFPSGHTTAAFTFFTLLALSIKTRLVQYFSIMLATSVGVSRIYLGQHFVNDVVAGAILGLFLSTVVFYYLDRKIQGEKLNKRLTQLI